MLVMRMQCNQIRNTTHNKGKNGKYNPIEYKRTRANYEKRLPALNSALKILQELATLDLVFFWPSSSVIQTWVFLFTRSRLIFMTNRDSFRIAILLESY